MIDFIDPLIVAEKIAITDEKNKLSVLSTKTEVSEYISHNLKIPLSATEIFTSKSVIIYFNRI